MTVFDLRDTLKEMKHIEEELQKLESRMLSPRTSVLSDMPKAVGMSNDKMAKDLIKLELLREKYNDVLEKMCGEQLELENMIEKLKPNERELIRYRYIDGCSWKVIQKEMNLPARTAFRIHKRAMMKLNKNKNSNWHSMA